jgi:hypothetical protein
MKSLLIFIFLYCLNLHAQVSYQSALQLAQSRASRMSGEITNSKIGNLTKGKRNYWFIAVFYDGGACLMSVPETKLEIVSSKCVNQYQIDEIIEMFNEITEFVDPLELERIKQQEQIEKRRREEEEEAQRIRIENERQLTEKLTIKVSDSLDALLSLSQYENAASLYSLHVNSLKINKYRDQIYLGLLQKYSQDTIALSKEICKKFIESKKEWFKNPNDIKALYFNTTGREIFDKTVSLDLQDIPTKNFGSVSNSFNVPLNSKISLSVSQKDTVLTEKLYFSSTNRPVYKNSDKEIFFFKPTSQKDLLVTPLIYDQGIAKNVIQVVSTYESTKYVNSILIYKNENREFKNIYILKKSPK